MRGHGKICADTLKTYTKIDQRYSSDYLKVRLFKAEPCYIAV